LAESPVSTKDSKATKDIRLGLVGAGAIAQLAHLPVLSKIKGAQLIALCDNDGPKASAIAERLKVPDVFTDIEDLLELGAPEGAHSTYFNQQEHEWARHWPAEVIWRLRLA